jgi:hypothetical protein
MKAQSKISFNIKCVATMALILQGGAALAADHSVGIVGLNGEFGSSLNLYQTTEKGPALMQNFVLQPTGPTMNRPMSLVMNPAHDFVYVAYLSSLGTQPNIVGFRITPWGLMEEWEQELNTGDSGLQETTLVAQDGYLIENTFPAFALWVHVLTQSGQQVVFDQGSNGEDLVSGHLDPHGRLYYSCRYVNSTTPFVNGPANTVVVYDLNRGLVNMQAPKMMTSTDPTYVQSICN